MYSRDPQTDAFSSPSSESYSAVTSWLNGNGIKTTNLTDNAQWLSFSVSVGKASELFGTDFSVYTHTDSGTDIIRTMSYSVPSDLSAHIDLVHPTTS